MPGCSPIPDMVATMPEVTEWFDPADGLAAPGSQVRDLFPDRICFDKSPRASDQEAEGESRSEYLDRLLLGCEWDPEGIVVATDASSVAGFEAYVGGERVFGSRFASGRVLAPYAELVAIRFAVTRVTSGVEPYKRITVFTDSIAAAERAVDPSLHSGQAHSLAVCKALNEWLLEDDDQEIKFIEVPSSAKWSVHYSAHLSVRGLPLIGAGSTPQTSLDYLRKKATDACQDAWVTRFQEAKYKGGQFLELNDLKGKPLQPKYTSGGTWLPHIGRTNSLTSRAIRCNTNHAPVGEYYFRFHIPESEDCRRSELGDLTDGLAAPGNRIRDLFPNRICFDKSPKASDQEAEGESRSDYLDRLLLGCEWDPEGIVMATDASVPPSTRHQSVAGFEAYVGGERVFGSRFASGRVLAPCAELVAIRFAVTRVTSGAEPYKRITVFTDSIAVAERAVDPSLHSGQAHSLAVCRALSEWLLEDDDREIKFVEVPSSAKWSVHHSAHLFVRGMPPIGAGSAPQTSLDYLHKKATDACQDAWVTRFQEAKYKGGQFLELNDLKGKPLQPKCTTGGTWLPHIGRTNSLTSRAIRCLFGTAVTGDRCALRGSTLTGTHASWALFPAGLSQWAHRDSLSMTFRPHLQAKKIVGPILDMVYTMPEVTEWFNLIDELATLGSQIQDMFPDRISFDKSPRASEQEVEGESQSDHLDHLLSGCEWDPEGIVVATDASVPPSTRHQSVAGFKAVTRITSGAEPYKRITVFTDSIASAERAVDPSLHSGQAHSLAVCKALNKWLLEDDDHEINRAKSSRGKKRLKWSWSTAPAQSGSGTG
ncbi:hypothetical protein PQX77_013404 [Marasmius sp. AFHP31]|nr:hypothetical protein PQX77_013404 [Marasmius sp. AFHP31]